MQYSSEQFIQTGNDMLQKGEKLLQLIEELTDLKTSIASNYDSESAKELYDLFDKIKERQADFSSVVKEASTYLIETVAPAYAKAEQN